MSDVQEINLEANELFEFHDKIAKEEGDAASDAGERRQAIGAFAEKTGVNNKALSQIRSGLKIKKEGKRLDWLRSMEIMLAHVSKRIRGESTMEMDLDGDQEPRVPDEYVNDQFALGERDFGLGYERHQSPYRGEMDQVKKSLWEQGWDKAKAAAESDEAPTPEATEPDHAGDMGEGDMTPEEVEAAAGEMDAAEAEFDDGDDGTIIPMERAEG